MEDWQCRDWLGPVPVAENRHTTKLIIIVNAFNMKMLRSLLLRLRLCY